MGFLFGLARMPCVVRVFPQESQIKKRTLFCCRFFFFCFFCFSFSPSMWGRVKKKKKKKKIRERAPEADDEEEGHTSRACPIL